MYWGSVLGSNSDNTMNVLFWGVILLGGIGAFVVWGLANAYPVIS
tara:strand:- start:243 stop:377 length:135 start_codon:yes stop_codon:yes gene_type:complete